MQAARFERLSFDPFPLLWNGFITPEEDVSGCDVVDALVISLVVVVVDEGFDLSFKVARQEVVFQQDAVPYLLGLWRLVLQASVSRADRRPSSTKRMISSFSDQIGVCPSSYKVGRQSSLSIIERLRI